MPVDPPRERVLIGASDRLQRSGLEQLFANWGCGVESFADGEGALERLLSPEAPGIALLDFDLPGKTCLEICQALRASDPIPSGRRCHRPLSPWIIAMWDGEWSAVRRPRTHNSVSQENVSEDRRFGAISTSEIEWVLQAGVCDVLTKPIRESELRLRLHTARYIQTLSEELEQSAEALGFGTTHDPLTGLWNREAFLSLLFQETDRAQRTGSTLALIAMDIDHFTQCNLELGFRAGDRILEQLAVRFRRHLRSYDILGRSGEDQFLAALPGCGSDDALSMAERLRVEVMHSPFHVKTAPVAMRASFGVAQSRGRFPLLVLREAETALAAAKRSGRDRVRHYELKLLGEGVEAFRGKAYGELAAAGTITNHCAILPGATDLPARRRF